MGFRHSLLCGIAFFAGSVLTRGEAAILVGPTVNPANGHTYYLLQPATWTASELEAVGLGGHLATIDDAAENAWVYTTFNGDARTLWIGLTDQASEGTFVWISGSTSTYRNFNPGEPNNFGGDEDYVHMFTAPTGGVWNDLANDTIVFRPQFGVVEVEAAAVPEPASLTLWGLGALGCMIGAYRRRRVA
jgi:hypothetical protein